VSFDLNEAEIHALVGENGAGKSTLIKILAGVYPHPEYGGEIMLEGAERRFANIREAEQAGISVIYQELSLVKELSVAENIFLGREPRRFGVINWERLYGRVQKLLADLHLEIDSTHAGGTPGYWTAAIGRNCQSTVTRTAHSGAGRTDRGAD